MSSSNCCFLTCIQISQEAGKVVWYSRLFKNFPQFVVIRTVRYLPLVGSFSSAKEFKCIVITPPFALHLLPSLISNCLKLPFVFFFFFCLSGNWSDFFIFGFAYIPFVTHRDGTRGRSWRLEANPCEQEIGGGKQSTVRLPCPEVPQDPVWFQNLFIFK